VPLRAEKARPPAGSRPGRSALAVTALVGAAASLTLSETGIGASDAYLSTGCLIIARAR
jgi:hypothetical protein